MRLLQFGVWSTGALWFHKWLIPWVKNTPAVEAKHFFVVIVDWKSVCYYIWDSLALMSPKNKEMSARFHSTLPNAFDWWCDAYVGDSSGISIKYNTWFNYFWRKKKRTCSFASLTSFCFAKTWGFASLVRFAHWYLLRKYLRLRLRHRPSAGPSARRRWASGLIFQLITLY